MRINEEKVPAEAQQNPINTWLISLWKDHGHRDKEFPNVS